MANKREPLSEQAVAERVADLLRADPVCNGRFGKAAVRAIAQIVAYPEPVVDADVLAERAACLRAMGAVHARLSDGPQGSDGDAWGKLEARRLSEAMTAVGRGLHRGEAGA